MSDVAAFAAEFFAIVGRDRYRGARFGLAVHDLATGTIVFEHDAHFYFQGASTTKIPTTASALAALGSDFRFHTRVRHTGRLAEDGTLHGDLVLVAGGDPNLSARVRSDDTLAFEDVDHALSGMPGAQVVPGDPLHVLRLLAQSVAANGVTRITGRVCIDITLFDEGYREPGTSVVISPIVVNDNVVNVRARAGAVVGARTELEVQPASAYASFRCDAVVAAADSAPSLTLSGETQDSAGVRTVHISGSLPAGLTQLYAHPVESPSTFARVLFVELLEELGVIVETGTRGHSVYLDGDAAFAPAILADHISPPFGQAIKIVNKVSQNLHAELCPRIVGATVADARGPAAEDAGFAYLATFLASNVPSTDGVIQGDACGMFGYYTPNYMCRLLRAIAQHPIDSVFRASLPVLGRDGTLHDIGTGSPAAGHVAAKTGTLGFEDRLRKRTIVLAKGLAGYIRAASGAELVFTAYANIVALEPGETWSHVGNVLGEIATAAYNRL